MTRFGPVLPEPKPDEVVRPSLGDLGAIRSLHLVAASVIALAACAPRAVWRGTDPERYVRAQVMAADGKQWLRIGKEDGPRFDGVGSDDIVFNTDGSRVAYPALRAGKWAMVVDGVEHGPWDGLAEPRFSRDAKHFAFLAEDPAGWRAVVDGVAGPAFETIQPGTLRFSPAGAHVAYVARLGPCAHVVANGVVGDCYERVRSLRVTNSGLPLALVQEGPRSRLISGAENGVAYDEIGEWIVTEEGGRTAYAARDGDQWRVVVDGLESARCAAVRDLRFGDRGRRVAWVCGDGAAVRVVIDRLPGRAFRHVSAPSLAPDGPSFVYAGYDERGAWVVTQGGERGPFAAVQDLQISKDGSAVAFVARSGGQLRVVHREREIRLDLVLDDTLVLSDDGQHWAVLTGERRSRRFFFCIDGERAGSVEAAEIFGEAHPRLRHWMSRVLREATRETP
jgi:hypothetical protein